MKLGWLWICALQVRCPGVNPSREWLPPAALLALPVSRLSPAPRESLGLSVVTPLTTRPVRWSLCELSFTSACWCRSSSQAPPPPPGGAGVRGLRVQ